ncbi:MAG: Ig-like domain-containing protein [Thermoleophilaceae bacterium]
MKRLAITAALAASAAAFVSAGGAATPAPGPDLVPKRPAVPATAAAGAQLVFDDVVRNRVTRRAGKSASRYYLSQDKERSKADRRLGGKRRLGSLGDRTKAKVLVSVTVPANIPQRSYWLLSCADDRKRINELREGNNCRASRAKVKVLGPLPTATPQDVSGAEDSTIAVTLKGSDPDGDALTFEVLTQPSHGTLSGTAPNLTYTPGPDYNGLDLFDFRVSDARSHSLPVRVSIKVTAAPDAPRLDTTNQTLGYAENAGPVAVDPGLTVTEPDDGQQQIAGAVVRIGSSFTSAQDDLVFTGQSGITGVYDDSTGTLTLTGSASIESYQAALRTVAYRNTSDAPNTAARAVSFQVTDESSMASEQAQRIVTVTAVNDSPVLQTSAGSTPYDISAEPGGALIDQALTASDVDDARLEGATIRITGGFVSGDELLFASQFGITGTYDSGTGVLTLSGSAEVIAYQAVLRHNVRFRNTGASPSSRTISFTGFDGSLTSSPVTKTVTVQA